MNEQRLMEMARDAGLPVTWWQKAIDAGEQPPEWRELKRFAQLAALECIEHIETHRIPVGNSAAGEMACEWTYDALREIRDNIKEQFDLK